MILKKRPFVICYDTGMITADNSNTKKIIIPNLNNINAFRHLDLTEDGMFCLFMIFFSSLIILIMSFLLIHSRDSYLSIKDRASSLATINTTISRMAIKTIQKNNNIACFFKCVGYFPAWKKH